MALFKELPPGLKSPIPAPAAPCAPHSSSSSRDGLKALGAARGSLLGLLLLLDDRIRAALAGAARRSLSAHPTLLGLLPFLLFLFCSSLLIFPLIKLQELGIQSFQPCSFLSPLGFRGQFKRARSEFPPCPALLPSL